MRDYPEAEADGPAAFPALNFAWMLQTPTEELFAGGSAHDAAYSDDQPLSRSRLVELMSQSSAGGPLVVVGAEEPQDARPELSDEQQRAEARQALSRLAESLRQSIEVQQRALADIGDIMEALR